MLFQAPYVKHWKNERKELEKLYRELGLDLSPESQRELRLIRDFSQNVDGILVFLQDVLMPRKVEVHFDDGFEAVREALRRRIRTILPAGSPLAGAGELPGRHS